MAWSPIEGKVARIVSERDVVINRGREHRVAVGMKFVILADEPLVINDPDTGEVIERLPREKARVQAIQIADRVAVCRTYQTRLVRGVGGGVILEPWEMYDHKVPTTLEVENRDLPPPLPRAERIVRVGDRVVQVDDEG
jgi:hypothetical protein